MQKWQTKCNKSCKSSFKVTAQGHSLQRNFRLFASIIILTPHPIVKLIEHNEVYHKSHKSERRKIERFYNRISLPSPKDPFFLSIILQQWTKSNFQLKKCAIKRYTRASNASILLLSEWKKRTREQLNNLKNVWSEDNRREGRKTLLFYWFFIAVCIVKCIL